MTDPGDYSAFAAELQRRHGPLPLSASLDLTFNCNFACRHCYVRHYRAEPELDTAEVVRLLADLAELGCLSLLLTGGEPLTRPDFGQIWRSAKQQGFLLTLFTNAARVDPETAALLTDLPPLLCEVTLYGACDDTYAAVTGQRAWSQVRAGLDRLAGCNCRVHLKAPILAATRPDLPALGELAAAYGWPLYVDGEFFPRLDGDLSPLELAVDLRTLAAEEREDPFHREVWAREFARPQRPSRLDKQIVCRGGEQGLHIGPYGDACLCPLLREPSRSWRREGLREAWRFINGRLRTQACVRPRRCYNCEDLAYCVPCAGKNRLTTGDPDLPAPQVCARARALREFIESERRAL